MLIKQNIIRTALISVMGLALGVSVMAQAVPKGHRVGIIGLDTSHSTAFTQALNDPNAGDTFGGYKVVAAFPQGSLDIKSSVDRIPGYTEAGKKLGVEIVGAIGELLEKVDVVLLETNDGRRHLEQALPVLKAGKRMFIDKPIAASLADAMAIFDAAKQYNVPIFSASSLRYIQGMEEVKKGEVGKVLGAEAYSPSPVEKTHPDFFWYGIHGVETLFTAMGTGCKTVTRVHTEDTDVVTGIWEDGRIGSFRGLRAEKKDYGGGIFGDKAIKYLGTYNGYNPLLKEIIRFFQTGIVPVQPEETLEILTFMEAADLSKAKGGVPVSMDDVMKKAQKLSNKISNAK
ncbi:MAG: Gfo/Idh/MocA family oxidoreductase [Bacteroidales bacterium]|nr:Gfo/Idh/MocA family oxidoreductase [Bacteroidales bacterium]